MNCGTAGEQVIKAQFPLLNKVESTAFPSLCLTLISLKCLNKFVQFTSEMHMNALVLGM